MYIVNEARKNICIIIARSRPSEYQWSHRASLSPQISQKAARIYTRISDVYVQVMFVRVMSYILHTGPNIISEDDIENKYKRLLIR